MVTHQGKRARWGPARPCGSEHTLRVPLRWSRHHFSRISFETDYTGDSEQSLTLGGVRFSLRNGGVSRGELGVCLAQLSRRVAAGFAALRGGNGLLRSL